MKGTFNRNIAMAGPKQEGIYKPFTDQDYVKIVLKEGDSGQTLRFFMNAYTKKASYETFLMSEICYDMQTQLLKFTDQ